MGRARIFRNLAVSLGRNQGNQSNQTIADRRDEVAEHFVHPAVLPAGSAIGTEISDITQRFCLAAKRMGASVSCAENIDTARKQLTSACASAVGGVAKHGLYAASSGDVRLNQMLEVFTHAKAAELGAAEGGDSQINTLTLVEPETSEPLTFITHADAAIAESGNVVFFNNGDTPRRWHVLATHLIVVVDANDIVADYQDVDDYLRRVGHQSGNPWSVSWLAGPSRTADIEQTLIIGAHGPVTVHLLVLSSSSDQSRGNADDLAKQADSEMNKPFAANKKDNLAKVPSSQSPQNTVKDSEGSTLETAELPLTSTKKSLTANLKDRNRKAYNSTDQSSPMAPTDEDSTGSEAELNIEIGEDTLEDKLYSSRNRSQRWLN